MVDVSVIIPVYNSSEWLADTLNSILKQSFNGKWEVSICDDSSTDDSVDIIKHYKEKFIERGVGYIIGLSGSSSPRGVGYTRNKAIAQSSGVYLCLHDSDDIMLPNRLSLQYQHINNNVLLGGRFVREPIDSTIRYTKWANSLNKTQLYTQAFTSFGPTIIIPTWFMSRDLFNEYGPFDETGKGTPEDLIFFYKLLRIRRKDGRLVQLKCIREPLIIYRYHSSNTTLNITEETIWTLRVQALEECVLSKWKYFTIWNAGKQGRQLYRSLTQPNRDKVLSFCDVDTKKISKGFYTFEESKDKEKPKVPIVHFKEAMPPLIICVKWDLTGGEFEANLSFLRLIEGLDYYNFS